MTKHEADVIGGLNMTDQISNEAYKQIMIAAQDENEVSDVLDNIRAEIDAARFLDKDKKLFKNANASGLEVAMDIIDRYMAEGSGEE